MSLTSSNTKVMLRAQVGAYALIELYLVGPFGIVFKTMWKRSCCVTNRYGCLQQTRELQVMQGEMVGTTPLYPIRAFDSFAFIKVIHTHMILGRWGAVRHQHCIMYYRL